jgi:hypothetical protein
MVSQCQVFFSKPNQQVIHFCLQALQRDKEAATPFHTMPAQINSFYLYSTLYTLFSQKQVQRMNPVKYISFLFF